MEQDRRVKVCRSHRGMAIVTVLFITGIGLLFGAGALLLFRYQCQLRIERQHEMEKVYAVRSAVNYIRTYGSGEDVINNESNPFKYHTDSGRDLGVIIKPVEKVFPNDPNHFDMTQGHFRLNDRDFGGKECTCQNPDAHYNGVYDYEYGAIGVTNFLMYSNSGIMIDDLNATNNVKWWVNIGMRDKGGWLAQNYGLRYCFHPIAQIVRSEIKDIMRLCIVRNVTNHSNNVQAGHKHGWPLSMEGYDANGIAKGERAIVFELKPLSSDLDTEKNAHMTLFEYVYTGGLLHTNVIYCVEKNLPLRIEGAPSMMYMGMQIAGDKVAMFYVNGNADPSSGGYTFPVGVGQLTSETYKYFSEGVTLKDVSGWRQYYDGTNVINGKIIAPELRAVFEIESSSTGSGTAEANDKQNDWLTDFRVTPAYQYDVYLENPRAGKELATVVQKTIQLNDLDDDRDDTFSTITYDTHGTENKGFRKDEREAAERGGTQ